MSDNRQSQVPVGDNEESHVLGGTHCLTAVIPSLLSLLSLIPQQPLLPGSPWQQCSSIDTHGQGSSSLPWRLDWYQILICFYSNTHTDWGTNSSRKGQNVKQERVLFISFQTASWPPDWKQPRLTFHDFTAYTKFFSNKAMSRKCLIKQFSKCSITSVLWGLYEYQMARRILLFPSKAKTFKSVISHSLGSDLN